MTTTNRLSDPKPAASNLYPFQYTPACATDIRKTFARVGQKPSVAEASRILRDIELLRNAHPAGQIHSVLNNAMVLLERAAALMESANG